VRSWFRGLSLALVACSVKSQPHDNVPTPAPPASAAIPAPAESLDLAMPVGPLVPYMPSSATWTGKGPPPTAFSIFAVPARSPVSDYARLDRDACEAELGKRQIAFTRAEDTPGVRAPVRVTGPLHGVGVHSPLPPAQRAKSRADLVDCRLVLSLDDFAATLAPRGIVEMIHMSAFRTRAEGGCTPKYDGEQHCAALAVDVSLFKRSDGTTLNVDRDFHGKIGTLTCQNGAHPDPETPAAKELWEIACAAAGKTFSVILTPNWNAQHKNHLHLELHPHEWVLVR
jgi:hypothetical protein